MTLWFVYPKMADFAIYKSQYVSDLAIYTSQDVGLCNLEIAIKMSDFAIYESQICSCHCGLVLY